MPRSRRAVLKTMAVAAAVPVYAQQAHTHSSDALVPLAKPYVPVFFSEEELATLAALVDIIIPRTDTPGASDAGVHRIIDSSLKESEVAKRQWREAFTWLQSKVDESGAKSFAALTPEARLAIIRDASEETDTAASRAFLLLKGAAVDAYYSTRQGLQAELGWHGNTFLSEFKGCTHPEHQA